MTPQFITLVAFRNHDIPFRRVASVAMEVF